MFKASKGLWILAGEIDDDSIAGIAEAFYRLKPKDSTLFLLHTPGGDATAALALAHDLSHVRKLETRGLGFVASSGVDLLQAGRFRSCSPFSEFLTHPAIGATKIADVSVNSYARQLTGLRDRAAAFYASRAGRSSRWWKTWFEKERHFGAADAKKLNLVDEIY
jgi:ATP-dependent protease ClpP protease subunit